MTSKSRRLCNLAAALLGASYLLGAAFLSSRFPPLNGDEVFVANHGYNMLSAQGQRYSLFDDIFAREIYPFRDAFLEGTRPVWDLWVGVFVRLSRTFTAARASSSIAGFLALGLLYGLGLRWGAPGIGLTLMGLFLIDPVFWAASSVVRPELPLLALNSLLLLWIFGKKQTGWSGFLVSLASGLSAGMHPNALLVFAGLVATYVCLYPRQRNVRSLLPLICGFSAGALIVFGLIDIARFKLARQTFLYGLYKPPLFTWPWNPLQWVKGVSEIFWFGPSYYFDMAKAGKWIAALRAHVLAFGLALFCFWLGSRKGLFTVEQQHRAKALLLGAAVCLLGMILLVARREALYALEIALFLAPIAAMALSTMRNALRPVQAFCVITLLISMGLFLKFVQQTTAADVPYTRWTQEVRAILPAGSQKIAGPCSLWFELGSERLRDVGALMYSRYYTGESHVAEWLGGWQPEILIIDPTFKQLFLPGDAGPQGVQALLRRKVVLRGRVNAGALGNWDVYAVDWK